MKLLIAFLLTVASLSATSPVTAYAISNVTTASDWTGASAANHWANSCNGTAGSSGASGGSGLAIWGQTATLPAGVPGAAGLGDSLVVCTGVTVHIPKGLGIECNNGSTDSTNCFTVQATDQNTFGSLIVDAGGRLKTHGDGSITNYCVVNQYADFHVMPNGRFELGSGLGGSCVVSGRAYFGCSDQTKYPMLDCSASAGGWVTASIASTLNFSGTLPTGLTAGDIVRVLPIQQPSTNPFHTWFPWLVPPPDLPVMPTVNDTGGVNHACGSLASCMMPFSARYCVVQISGSTVSLGWPLGGTTWDPYCTGSETAIAVTGTGSGQLWLEKPAFVWGDPGRISWNNSQSASPSNGSPSALDAVVSTWAFGDQPVSNAAGTGPGRPGDSSLVIPTFTTPAGLPTCTKFRQVDVTAGTCMIDYDRGLLFYGGFNTNFATAAAMTWKGATAPGSGTYIPGGTQITVPAGARTYNELIAENVDFQGLETSAQQYPILMLATLPNTANNHMAIRYSTSFMSNVEWGLGDFTASAANPVEVTGNMVLDSNWSDSSDDVHIARAGASQYFDISENLFVTSKSAIACTLYNGSVTGFKTAAHGSITNNQVIGDQLIGGDGGSGGGDHCQWQDLLVQDNGITGTGTQNTIPYGTYPGMPVGEMHNDNGPTLPNYVQWNQSYGTFRAFTLDSNQIFQFNLQGPCWHHCLLINRQDAAGSAGYIQNAVVQNNIILPGNTQVVDAFDVGYLNQLFADNIVIRNNTMLGMPAAGGSNPGAAGVMFGDPDPGASQLIIASIYNNSLGPNGGVGLSKQISSGVHMQQIGLKMAGYNSSQGSSTMYQGISPNLNNVPNPEYYRNAVFTQSGSNYNTSASRAITGIYLQNPNFASSSSIAIKYNYTSAASITMQMSSDGGSNYGTAVQLNWGGSGQTYTVSSISDPGSIYTNMTVTVSGTPFATLQGASVMPATAPAARWALMQPGSSISGAFALFPLPTGTTPTGSIYFTPRPAGISVSDTFAVIKSEIRLADAGGTNTIDVFIDPRSLPTASQTDTGISFVNTDYCASPCATGAAASGLPTTFTNGGPNTPLFAVAPPAAGGSAALAFCNGQSVCGSGSPYVSGGSAWPTGGLNSGYIGAIMPAVSTAGTVVVP